MKILLNRLYNSKNKPLANNKGQSYLEFSIMIIIVITIFYTIFEVFWLINAQVLITNTCKSALHEIEAYGEVKGNFISNIENSLNHAGNLHSISIVINNVAGKTGEKYQYRTPITLTLKAKYNITILNNVYKGDKGITLGATYSGISQRLHKSMEGSSIITE